MSNVVPLGSLLALLVDHRGRTPRKLGGDFAHAGIPVLSAKHVKNGSIVRDEDWRFVTEAMWHAWMPRKLEPGDILLTSEAPLGEVARVGPDARICLGQRLFALRADPRTVDGTWLFYALRGPELQARLDERGSGTTAIGIRQAELVAVPVEVPPLAEQRAVGELLSVLDDKIDLNRRMNRTLEEMASALFRSWFVDFDPVVAKAAGRAPLGMDAATAALFPSSFEDSDLGPIPRGWRVGRLDEVLVLQRGFDLPSSLRVPGPFPVIAAGGVHGTHNKSMVRGPGIGTGRSGVLGNVYYVHEDFWPLNTSLWVKEFKNSTPAYAFHLLRRLDFLPFNAGSAVPTLNRNHVHGLPTLVAPMNVVRAFDAAAGMFLQQEKAAEEESRTLAALRDILLPKLLSGEIRLRDAERAVEAVA